MFSKSDLEYLKQSPYNIVLLNNHDVTIHSTVTGHDWIIVSSYGAADCYILHRHSGRYSYHRQEGAYKSLKDALIYIDQHENWFVDHKMKSKNNAD